MQHCSYSKVSEVIYIRGHPYVVHEVLYIYIAILAYNFTSYLPSIDSPRSEHTCMTCTCSVHAGMVNRCLYICIHVSIKSFPFLDGCMSIRQLVIETTSPGLAALEVPGQPVIKKEPISPKPPAKPVQQLALEQPAPVSVSGLRD